jgi:hypothetical protein
MMATPPDFGLRLAGHLGGGDQTYLIVAVYSRQSTPERNPNNQNQEGEKSRRPNQSTGDLGKAGNIL